MTANLMSAEGLEKLKAEIDHLTTEGRNAVALRIKEARAHGDISENAEYDAAKHEQALLEGRIAALEQHLRGAQVIEETSRHMIGLATPFVLEDLASGSSHRYSVVSTYEADAGAGKLSAESPVGRAVIGARAGDTVTVATPRGERKFKVTGIGG
jgi:transcription elongation factor GreA